MKKITLFLFVFVFCSSLKAQNISDSVNLQAVFNTGYFLGKMETSSRLNLHKKDLEKWKKQFQNYWDSTFIKKNKLGNLEEITPENINQKVNKITSELFKFQCATPAGAAYNIFMTGFRLGQATIETESDCSGCLKQRMLEASSGLYFSAGVNGYSAVSKMSGTINRLTSEVYVASSKEEALKINQPMKEKLLEIYNTLHKGLPKIQTACEAERIYIPADRN